METHDGPQGRIRLSDVAELAGVSTATVSRVLSHPERVAKATRDAVVQTLEQTGYRVNQAARNLRKGKTSCVVALVPNLGNPFFAKILDGMGRELAASGYDLLVADTIEESSLSDTLNRFLNPSRTDAVILLDGRASAIDLMPAADRPPIISVCEWTPRSSVPRVILDNQQGGRMAASHLCDLGHSHVGVIGGPTDNVLHQSRLEGVQALAARFELTFYAGDFSLQAGQAAAREWLKTPPAQRPTAIVSFSDEMACAFIADVTRAGISVPHDVSVVGFDDIELASHLYPALTTIRQPKRDIGRKAAQVAIAAISGREVPQLTLLEPQLMLRETTAKPRL